MEPEKVQKPSILYVDDVDTNLVLFEASFSSHFDITLANSAKEALEILEKKVFSVIISDQSMPEMSGTELLEITKTKYPDMMRFILTAYTDYDTVVETINKGEVYGFFNKPFDVKAVRSSLLKAIEVYELRISNKRMVSELEKLNQLLLNIDKSKTRYLNNITNEIRSPINKIMSAIHMLKDRIDSNDLNELLFYLDTSVSRLESFSFAANQLARLNDETSDPVKFNDVSVVELVELCMIENKDAIDKFEPDINISEVSDIHVKGEFDLLMTCLTTLLMSSLKHIETRGSLKIISGIEEAVPFIEILDQGVAYAGKQLENTIRFFDDSKNSNDFTPGIELILAKQVMESHKGRIKMIVRDDNSVSTKMIFPSEVS